MENSLDSQLSAPIAKATGALTPAVNRRRFLFVEDSRIIWILFFLYFWLSVARKGVINDHIVVGDLLLKIFKKCLKIAFDG